MSDLNFYEITNAILKRIPHKQEQECSIIDYNHKSGGLTWDLLRIHIKSSINPNNFFLLDFIGVSYFSGPFVWLGAEFQIANVETTIKLYQYVKNRMSNFDYEESNHPRNLPFLIEVKPLDAWRQGDEHANIRILARSLRLVEG
jgi:hypothetical protein